MADWKIPFGRAKGELITETDAANIRWASDALQKKLDEDPNKAFADKDRAWLVAAKAELKRREGGGTQLARQPAAAPQAIERSAPPLVLGSSMNDPAAVSAHLARLSETHHLVSPASTVDCLPPGCGVAVSYVLVNPSTDKNGPGEVYALTGGKVGLSGTTISKIGITASVDWDTERSGRLDNGADPHYVHYRAVGYGRNFDGSKRTISGEVEIDAREGSPQLEEITAKAVGGNRDPATQIRELRKFLLRHAESKAKNRAIASGFGLKRSYHPKELEKPFAVCRLMFTGQSDNPEERRMFAEKTADAMVGGMASMYGRPTPQPPPAAHALPAPQRYDTTSMPQFAGHAPPPVGPTQREVDEFDGYEPGDYQDASIETNSVGATGGTAQAKPKATKAAAPAAPAAPAKTAAEQAAEDHANGIDPNY